MTYLISNTLTYICDIHTYIHTYIHIHIHIHIYQLASEPRTEGYYDAAVGRMHTLLSIVSIIQSTEADFSVISEDTAVDASGFFSVTMYLLLNVAQEEMFSQYKQKQSATLHDTFFKLLHLLDHCLADSRFVAKLAMTEDTVM
jgi:hypothetical protein